MRKFLIVLICFFLTACGFHLRDQNHLSPTMQTLYLESVNPYSTFTALLRHTLHSLNVLVVTSPDKAPTTLRIVSEELSHTMPLVTASNQATNYVFTLTVLYEITTAQGKVLLIPQLVSATRSITLNSNQMIDANPEVSIVTRELQFDIVNQILNRLNSQEVYELTQKI